MINNKPAYHDVRAVARRFGRSPRTVRDWIAHGCPTPGGLVRLEAARVGRRWMIRDDWLERFEFRVVSSVPRPDPDTDDTDGTG